MGLAVPKVLFQAGPEEHVAGGYGKDGGEQHGQTGPDQGPGLHIPHQPFPLPPHAGTSAL